MHSRPPPQKLRSRSLLEVLQLNDWQMQRLQIEFGGLADDHSFVRTVVRYGAGGGIASVRWDQFMAPL